MNGIVPPPRLSKLAVTGLLLAIVDSAILIILLQDTWSSFRIAGFGWSLFAIPGLVVSLIAADRCSDPARNLAGKSIARAGITLSSLCLLLGIVGLGSCLSTVYRYVFH